MNRIERSLPKSLQTSVDKLSLQLYVCKHETTNEDETMKEQHTSALPHGKPFPLGDTRLWNALMNEAQTTGNHFDIVQRYADIRGITRGQAKDETFSIRYFGKW